MAITLNGTTGITTDGGYTGDGVSFADGTPSNTLVTTTSGNVGIGTNAPTFPLDVRNSNLNVSKFQQTGSFQPVYMTSTTNLSGVMSETGNQNGLLMNSASNYTTLWSSGAEQMRIDSSGNLLVGTTSASGKITTFVGSGKVGYYTNKSSAGGGLDHAQYYTDGTLQGKITQTGGFTTVSDYRLKSDVAPLSGMLEKICRLKPVSYTLTAFDEHQFGFIAHELQEEFPVFVDGVKDAINHDGSIAPQSVDYPKMVSALTAAIQELKAELDTVKTQLADTNLTLADAKAELATLKGTV